MNKRLLGNEMEKAAARFLTDNGYRILDTNFFCNAGEIDIIAQNEGYLCFIEVKYRTDLSRGYPAEAVGPAKAARISRSALYYMNMKGMPESTPCRFDVVAILGDKIELIKDAFEAVL